jgi:proteic killer suppression protein
VLRIEFEDDSLRRLYSEPEFHLAWMGTALAKNYRRKMALVAAARDERDLLAMRSLRFEKLVADREGQHSIRLNDQYRLILRLRTENDVRVAVVVEVTDYH